MSALSERISSAETNNSSIASGTSAWICAPIAHSNFDKFNFDDYNQNDFVYCDPPYLITTGTYNDGKRGFTGWTKKEEKNLLRILSELNNKNIKFALSNVLKHKGESNDILMEWITRNNFYVVHLNKDYSNSNYQTKNNNITDEVLITNYRPIQDNLNS